MNPEPHNESFFENYYNLAIPLWSLQDVQQNYVRRVREAQNKTVNWAKEGF